MSLLNIIPFESQYARYFRDLNIQWLEKYFHVEPKDVALLNECEKNIINKGGFIFFAAYNDKIVGCFAFIKIANKSYELGKMAVDTDYQGKKIGQKLLQYAIDFGENKSWDLITLYSSTKLNSALHIYKKYGFQEVVLEDNLPYIRSDIKMELNL